MALQHSRGSSALVIKGMLRAITDQRRCGCSCWQTPLCIHAAGSAPVPQARPAGKGPLSPHARAHAPIHAFQPASGCRHSCHCCLSGQAHRHSLRVLMQKGILWACKIHAAAPVVRNGLYAPLQQELWPCARSKGCSRASCSLAAARFIAAAQASAPLMHQGLYVPLQPARRLALPPGLKQIASARTCMCCCSRASTSPWLFCNGL